MSPATEHPGVVLVPYEGHTPRIHPTAFVAPGATLIGRVVIQARASVWYGCVLRGDNDELELGEDSNLQDGSIVHADPGHPVRIGRRVTVGHGAVVHGATLHDDVLFGMRATILNGAVVESHSLVAAGALIPPNRRIPTGSLAAGMPAKVVGDVREQDLAMIERIPPSYVDKAERHRRAVRDALASQGEPS